MAYEEEDIMSNLLGMSLDMSEDAVDSKGFYIGKFPKEEYLKLKAIADMYQPGKNFQFRKWVRIAVIYFIRCELDGISIKKHKY